MEIELVECSGILEGELFPYISRVVQPDHIFCGSSEKTHCTEIRLLHDRIECIKTEELGFDGTQYLMTDVVPTANTRIEIRFRSTSPVSGRRVVFGSMSRGYGAADGFGFALGESGCQAFFGSQTGSVTISEPDEYNTVVVSQVGCLVNGYIEHGFDSESFEGTFPLCIGSADVSGTPDAGLFSGAVSRVRVSENDNPVLDLVPAMTAEGNYGMFDVINMEFYQRLSVEDEIVSSTGALPVSFRTSGVLLEDCIVYGNSGGVGNKRAAGKNLFDEVYDPAPGAEIAYMPVYVGDGTFTLSGDIPLNSQNYANLFLLRGNVSTGAATGESGVWSGNPCTKESNDGYVTIAYRNYNGSQAALSPADYHVMLEKSSTATDYEPYSCRYDIPVTVHGKNLIQQRNRTRTQRGITFTPNADGSVTLNGTANDSARYVLTNDEEWIHPENGDSLPAGTYTASYSGDAGVSGIGCFYGVYESGGSSRYGKGTFTISEGDKVALQIQVNSGTVCNDIKVYPQLEAGSTATDYEPYFSDTVTLVSDAPLYEGDFISLADESAELAVSPQYNNILTVGTAVQPDAVTVEYDY